MLKIYGATAAQNGLYKIGRKKWEVIYGFGKDSEDADTGYNYRQRYDHRPSLEEIKADIVAEIKNESELRLKYGIKWNGFTVEYSEMLKTDLIGLLVGLNGGIMSFPQQINLGSNANGIPNTYTFNSAEELAALAAIVGQHRGLCSTQEWEEINALGDMDEYKTEQ